MIQIENLSASYGRIQALRAVTLNILSGMVFAVLGANGAGKTTLLRSILGLVSTTGTVRLDGEDISRLATYERIRRGIAIVPEGRRLFSDLSVRENLLIGAINRTDRTRVQSELHDICDAFPILGKRRDQPAKSLSGGEVFATCTAGLFDGFRVDTEGRLWCSSAEGVHVYAPDGALIGKILIPEIVGNVTFGGAKRNRLYIAGTTSLYSMYTFAKGCKLG